MGLCEFVFRSFAETQDIKDPLPPLPLPPVQRSYSVSQTDTMTMSPLLAAVAAAAVSQTQLVGSVQPLVALGALTRLVEVVALVHPESTKWVECVCVCPAV